MRKQAICAVVAAVVISVGYVSSASAQVAAAPFNQFSQTKMYKTWMARAMDECNPATVTVHGITTGGCPQANSTTADSSVSMKSGLLTVLRIANKPSHAKVLFLGYGFTPLSHVQLQLTIRATHAGTTFVDTPVTCGNQDGMGCFVARKYVGSVIGREQLTDCLTQSGLSTGLDDGNLEIVGAGLYACDSSCSNCKLLATPGVED